MKNYWHYILLAIIVIFLFLAIYSFVSDNKKNNIEKKTNKNEIILTINNQDLIVELEDNSTSEELLKRLKYGKITISAKDYGNYEKVGELGFDLPSNDNMITTKAGDIIIYQGNKICIYYAENTWRMTKIGHIKDISAEELIKLLGKKDIKYKLSLKGE